MRSSGVRGVLIYCSDYRCSHWTAISGDQWPDYVRLSDDPIRACRDLGSHGRDAELKRFKHPAKITAAPEKYQFCSNTAPARGSAEAANPTEGGLLVGEPKLRRVEFEIGGRTSP
jgi:hypothetical protein